MTEQLHRHLELSSTYWQQALELLKKGERTKASELAWGSVAQAIKALALTQGKKTRGHDEYKRFVVELAGQLRDKELADLYEQQAERAHANFYEDFMGQERVREAIAAMERLREKIYRLLPQGLR